MYTEQRGGGEAEIALSQSKIDIMLSQSNYSTAYILEGYDVPEYENR